MNKQLLPMRGARLAAGAISLAALLAAAGCSAHKSQKPQSSSASAATAAAISKVWQDGGVIAQGPSAVPSMPWPAARATGGDSVSLGAGSDDGGQLGVVAVGSRHLQRRIIGVRPGHVRAGSWDAVTGGQLWNAEQEIQRLQHEIDQLRARYRP